MLRLAANDRDALLLAHILGNGQAELPVGVARYLLQRKFNSSEKERMHDLAARNQANALSESEREELFAYARVGTVLGILKSKARQALKEKAKKRTQA